MRLACIQLCSGTDILANIEHASRLIRDAAKAGADYIFTPEMTNIIQKSPKALFESIATEDYAPEIPFFANLAKELSVHLLIGSMAIKTGERRAVNRSYLFDPQGGLSATYDKIHLFDVDVSDTETWRESNIYDRGEQTVMAQMGPARLGMSICYDLRFAALYRHYGQASVDIITVPAAFTRPTGQAHWETLLRARAIETGAFIIAPAQGGHHADGRKTWGHSLVISPWGDIIAHMDHDDEGYMVADIDLADVSKARARIPAWAYEADYKI